MSKIILAVIASLAIILLMAAVVVISGHRFQVEAMANPYDEVKYTSKGAVAYIRDHYPTSQHPCLYPIGDGISELPNINRLLAAEMHPEEGEGVDYPTTVAQITWINLWQYQAVEYPVIRVVLRDVDNRRVLDMWEKRQDGSWHQAKNL